MRSQDRPCCGCHFYGRIPRSRKGMSFLGGILGIGILLWLQYRQGVQMISSLLSSSPTFNVPDSHVPASQQQRLVTITTALSKKNASSSPRRRRRLLMAQYTGRSVKEAAATNDTYELFLRLTSPINIAYAVQWQYDYWILRGLPFSHGNATYTIERHVRNGQRLLSVMHHSPTTKENSSLDDNDNSNSQNVSYSRATYNKLTLLQLALQHNEEEDNDDSYDGLLILDADAMMYDFSRDIASLLSPSAVLVAHRTSNTSSSNSTGSINIGVTLWNLRHPLTPYIYQKWRYHCERRLPHKRDDDQAPLQHLLKHELDAAHRAQVVRALDGPDFHYASGTWVRHFIRPAQSTWSSSSVTTATSDARRLDKMQRSIAEVCARHVGVCE